MLQACSATSLLGDPGTNPLVPLGLSFFSCRLQIITMMPEKLLELNLANRAQRASSRICRAQCKLKIWALVQRVSRSIKSIENFKTAIAEH